MKSLLHIYELRILAAVASLVSEAPILFAICTCARGLLAMRLLLLGGFKVLSTCTLRMLWLPLLAVALIATGQLILVCHLQSSTWCTLISARTQSTLKPYPEPELHVGILPGRVLVQRDCTKLCSL